MARFEVRVAIILAMLELVAAHIACAPEHAETVRQDKSLTLGLPGISYRPNGKLSIGVTGSYARREKMTVNTKERGVTALAVNFDTNRPKSLDGDKEVVASHATINPFIQYFPWSSSDFLLVSAVVSIEPRIVLTKKLKLQPALLRRTQMSVTT